MRFSIEKTHPRELSMKDIYLGCGEQKQPRSVPNQECVDYDKEIRAAVLPCRGRSSAVPVATTGPVRDGEGSVTKQPRSRRPRARGTESRPTHRLAPTVLYGSPEWTALVPRMGDEISMSHLRKGEIVATEHGGARNGDEGRHFGSPRAASGTIPPRSGRNP